jgi:multidrug efflux pump subunit AcrA (membrane-fusion protein)
MLTRKPLCSSPYFLGSPSCPVALIKRPRMSKPPPPRGPLSHPPDPTRYRCNAEFTGYTRAVKTVKVRAPCDRLSRQSSHFQDGTTVHEGELLDSIDPRTYKAEVDKTEALFKQSGSAVERLSSDLRRGRTLASGRAISSEELERLNSSRNEAESANLRCSGYGRNGSTQSFLHSRRLAPLRSYQPKT